MEHGAKKNRLRDMVLDIRRLGRSLSVGYEAGECLVVFEIVEMIERGVVQNILRGQNPAMRQTEREQHNRNQPPACFQPGKQPH